MGYKKNDTLKNKVRFSSTLPPKLNEGLKELSKKTRIPISVLLGEAIEDLLEKYKKV